MNIPKNSLLDGSGAVPTSRPSQSTAITDLALTTSASSSTPNEKTWVTCFGFPPGQSELVIEHLRTTKRVPVVDFEPKSDRTANWVHVKLRSQKDVAVALGESGQVLDVGGVKFMIGVALFVEGDQLDANAIGKGAESATGAAASSVTVQPGGGPRKASTLWEKAAVWLMDM